MAGAAVEGGINAGSPRLRSRSSRVLPLLPALFVLALALQQLGADVRGVSPRVLAPDDSGAVVTVDSTDSIATGKRERANTPATLTWHQFDSLAKHSNIYCIYIGDTTGRYVSREHVVRLLENQHYRGRDSSFVFQGDECIRIELRLGTTAAVPDTILWINQCQGSPCLDTLTIPLGCYEEREETIESEMEVTVCDTTCYRTDTLRSHRRYILMEDYQKGLLTATFGCSTALPASSSAIWLLRKGSRWYGPLSGDRPFAGAADDSCWIDPFYAAMYEIRFGPAGYGYWTVDTTINNYGSAVVDCALFGQAGISRIIDNCRSEIRTNTVIRRFQEWIYSGRDTTIINRECDPCLVPYFMCDGGTLDSTRQVRYIYADTVKLDTLKELCVREWTYPIGGTSIYKPKNTTACTSDSATLAFLRANWVGKGASNWSSGKPYRLIDYGTSICIYRCEPEDEPTFYISGERWWALADLPMAVLCTGDTCQIETLFYRTVTAPCCGKDSSITIYCDLEGYYRDSTVIQIRVPNLGVPCLDSVVVGIVPTDTIRALVDSVVTWVRFRTPIAYKLQYQDTCRCVPILNGREFCGELWIVRDCDPPIYFGSDGKLHIPCDPAGSIDYEYVESLARLLSRRVDSLRHIVDSLLALPSGNTWDASKYESDFTVTAWRVHLVDANGENIAVTLPPSTHGDQVVVKRIDGSGNTVTLNGTVDGVDERTLLQYESQWLVFYDDQWFIISNHSP